MTVCALTTSDNPFNPIHQMEDWYAYDTEKGYHSCSLLARIARTSDQLSDKENGEEIERAIDEIVSYDLINIENEEVHYQKVKEEIKE